MSRERFVDIPLQTGGTRGSFRCDLNQLEARDEGLFPDKFRVEGEPRTLMECLAQCFESPAIGDVL